MKTQIIPINQITDETLNRLAQDIKSGAVVVLPTDTVYGVAADAFNEQAISRIYELKQRPAGAALQILISSTQQAEQITQRNEQAQILAEHFWPGALTMILRPNEKGQSLRRGFEGLGLRVPAHAELLRRLQAVQIPLACTSANVHGRPVITQEAELADFFNGKVEWILTGGNLSPVASSVLDLTSEPTLLREGALLRTQLEKVLHNPIK